MENEASNHEQTIALYAKIVDLYAQVAACYEEIGRLDAEEEEESPER